MFSTIFWSYKRIFKNIVYVFYDRREVLQQYSELTECKPLFVIKWDKKDNIAGISGFNSNVENEKFSCANLLKLCSIFSQKSKEISRAYYNLGDFKKNIKIVCKSHHH